MRVSKSFGAAAPLKPHLLQTTGGIAAEVTDVRKDVDSSFQNNEGRVGFPELDALDPGTLLAAGQASFVVVGRNLLQSQTFDILSFGTGIAKLDLELLTPGDSGIEVVIVQGTGALTTVLAAGVLTITLAVAGSTSNAVAAAINIAVSCVGVILGTGNGAGNMLVAAQTPMAGGDGYYAGNVVRINGQVCKPVHATGQWTGSSVTVLVPALTGRVATDIVGVHLQANGISALPLSAVLT